MSIYTHFRNFITGQIQRSKKDYYEHKFNAAKSYIKRTWSIINNIINTLKNLKVENTVKKIIHDDVVHVYAGDIANMFNDYFVDMAPVVWGIRIQPTFALVHVVRGD